MAELKEMIKLIENLYTMERMIAAMEKEPRYYNTDQLLYTNEVHTLKVIAQFEGITQKELTEKMFRTKGATSIIINKLEKKDLVVRREDKDDARMYRLYLTEKGRIVNDSHIRFDEVKISSWLEDLKFTEDELRQTNHLLETVAKYVEEHVL